MNEAIDNFSLDAVFVRRQRYWQNGYRPVAKWNPGAVDHDGQPIRNAGKASKGKDWREDAQKNPPRWVSQRPDSNATGTGFLCGEFVPFDVDVDDPELCDQVVALIEQRLGPTPLVRQGRAPKKALCYRCEGEPFRRIATAEMKISANGSAVPGPLGPGERKVLVECLAEGQSLTVDAIHPDTLEPYQWLDQHPLDIPLSDLPTVDEKVTREIIDAAEKLLRDAGAVKIRPPREEPPRRERTSNGSDFFVRANDWALRERDAWVRVIFPKAKRQGNGAWRIPATLRGLPASKQDISIHESGIRDFAEDRTMSPIDIVLEYGHGVHRGAARAAGLLRIKQGSEEIFDAAAWLLRQIGISPTDIGWQTDPGGPPPHNEIPELGKGDPPAPLPPDPPPPKIEPPGPPGELPLILVIGGHRHVAADKALAALQGARAPLYVQDVELVTIVPKKKKITKGEAVRVPCIHPVGIPLLGRYAGQVARYMQYDRDHRLHRIDPPKTLVEQMLSMPAQWPFPTITGICEAPGMRPDFSLLTTEGYDPQTGQYCDFRGLKIPRIAARPSRRDAERALQLLLALVEHFPAKSAASRSVMVSALITVVVRGCLDVVPMIVMSAPDAANGKTFFVHLCGVVATGQRVPPISMSPSAEEFEKRLIMSALEGRQIILIDNISRVLQSDTLCQLVEQQQCDLRALGTSKSYIVTNIFSPFVTGINAQIANDLTRRGLRAGLDANMERPEEKQYRDPLLLEHVLQRRGEYIAAALTLVRYYVLAGRPNALPPLASYRDWSDNVRSALVHIGGLADPCETMAEVRQTDPHRVKRAQVFEAWLAAMDNDLMMRADSRGLLTPELVRFAEAHPDLKEALLLLGGKRKPGEIDSNEVGRWLGKNEGTIALGHKLVCDRSNMQKPRWRLAPLSEVDAG
jgi:hypothetical protein